MPALAGGPGGAVTTGDIQRLQDDVYDAGSDLSRLRGRDAALADRLQDDLDELRDEVIYLKVKLRKEGDGVAVRVHRRARTASSDLRRLTPR